LNTTKIDADLSRRLADQLAVASKRLALLDVDGTLTTERSVWQLLMEEVGCWEPAGRANLERYSRGDISYAELCRLDGALFRTLRYSRLVDIAARVPRHAGLDEFFAALAEADFDVALISTGLRVLVNHFTERYRIAISVVNDLEASEDVCTGNVIIEVHERQKGEIARCIIERIHPDFVLAVGDSLGDMPLFEMADFSIAVNSEDDAVKRAVTLHLADGDLSLTARLLRSANHIARERMDR
jgi:phosphoserine phosphatase